MSSPTAADLRNSGPSGLETDDIERRRRLMQRWRRHSALIAILRRLLPALCVCILAAIAVWGGLNVIYGRGDGTKVASNADIRMLNPYIQGRTEKGQPYLVRATSAVRDNVDTAKLTLEKPLLNLGVNQPEWTKVRADHGVYREDTGMLDLRGNVVLDDHKGNHLVTEHAVVDTKKNNVDGNTAISGHGPLGAITASSYSLRDGGAYLHFEGHVKTRFTPHSQTPPAPAPAGH